MPPVNGQSHAPERLAEFLSTLSHDLRGACHGILLSMEMLRRDLANGRSGDELREDLDLARQAVIDASVRLERLITAERLRSGMMPNRPIEADLAPALRRAAEQSAACVPEATGRLAIELPTNLRAVVDPRLAGEMIGGLLDHALRQANAGGSIRVDFDPVAGAVRVLAPAPWLGVNERRLLAGAGELNGFDPPDLGLFVAGRCAALAGIELQTDVPAPAGMELVRIRFLAPADQVLTGSPMTAG